MKRCPSRGEAYRPRATCVAAIIAMIAGAAEPAQAQQQPELSGLTLEQLLDRPVVPIDVLGAHTHLAGEWMIGYRFGNMTMPGNREGTDRLSTDDVLGDFMVSPTEMTMEMHMFHVMHAPSDALTLSAMVPFKRLSMHHVTRMGGAFITESEGLGDVVLGGLFTVLGNPRMKGQRLVLEFGTGLPTGSVDVRGSTPAGSDQRLPYPMQLGSGTFDLRAGTLYLGQSDEWAWNGKAQGVVRLGTNDEGYTLGNEFLVSTSGSRKLTSWMSLSAEIGAQFRGDIEGSDPALNPALVPTADPARRGGKLVDLRVGLNLYVPRGSLEGNRFAIVFQQPLYESLNGPQLETGWRLEAGWTWTRQ